MVLPDKQFLKALNTGEILPSMMYWPQLDAILAADERHPFAVRDTRQLWKRASQWMYCNPNEPWAPETEQLFRLGFAENAAIGAARSQHRLLRTWTRFGTYAPSKEDQELIGSALNGFAGLQLLQFGFNAAAWASPEQQDEWLQQAEAEVCKRPTPSAFSMYWYLHGNRDLLSPAQKKDANGHLRGEMEDYPIAFSQARIVAAFHPERQVWTACMMDQAWSIAKNPGPDDLWTNASEAIGHLDAMLDAMPWDNITPENTRCLVTAALMAREDNLLNLDMTAWDRRSPDAWAQAKSMLPVLECLHNIPAGPYDSGVAVNRLVPLVFDELRRLPLGQPPEMLVDSTLFVAP